MNREVNNIKASALSKLYEDQLLEIMNEWAEHTTDHINGGFITDFGEDFQLVSRRKNIWAQARQTYMFAACYEKINNDNNWLSLAKSGRDFLVEHAYAGNGRWNYEVSADGKEVVEGTTTVFTDLFVLSALSQYAAASGSKEDLELIRETFNSVSKNIPDSDFKDIKPHIWQKGISRHSIYMIAVNSCSIAEQILTESVTGSFIQLCIDKLLHFFGKNNSGYLLESLKEDGTVWDTAEGRLVNPGHIFEGMWFCIDYLKKRGKTEEIEEALHIIETTADKAIDRVYGGILHRFDCYGKEEDRELSTDTGLLKAYDKVDWVNCESLYTFALWAVLRKDQISAVSFYNLHEFCQQHFRPETGGDWYPVLNRDGSPLRRNKGGLHRVAFHVPRALMNLSLLLKGCGEEI